MRLTGLPPLPTPPSTPPFSAPLQPVPAGPPQPLGQALTPRDVPGDDALRALTSLQRERLLVGLALTAATSGTASVQPALRRVLREADPLAVRATLEGLAARGALGLVVQGAGLDWLLGLGRTRGVAVNEVLATTDSVGERGLTAREAQRVRDLFGASLDPDTVRLRFTRGVQTMGAGALVLGNTIHVDPTDPRWRLAPGTTTPAAPDDGWNSWDAVLLAHEAAHVWSYQHQGSGYALQSARDQLATAPGEGRGAAYAYAPGRPHLLSYGEEQRAMLVQDYAAADLARRRGASHSYTLYGGPLPVEVVLQTLAPYVAQLRAAGPGVAEPGPSGAVTLHGPAQDGIAGALGRHGDALIAGVGRAAGQALVQGLTRSQPGQTVAGAVGVVAAVAASVVSREQNLAGASSGGSAILDQAGLPRGVQLGTKAVAVGVRAAWDAPPRPLQGGLTVGLADPRGEVDVTVRAEEGVEVRASATLGRDGTVRAAGLGVSVAQPEWVASARAQVTPGRAGGPLLAAGDVQLTSEAVALSAAARVAAQGGEVRSLWARATVETRHAALLAEVQARGAPLALEVATLRATASPAPGLSLGATATLRPEGLEHLELQLGALDEAGSLALAASARHLGLQPSVGVALVASPRAAGLTVALEVEATPGRGEAAGLLRVSVPLPDPGR